MPLTSATDLGIRRTDVGETHTVAATVAAAFFDDPVTRWLVPICTSPAGRSADVRTRGSCSSC